VILQHGSVTTLVYQQLLIFQSYIHCDTIIISCLSEDPYNINWLSHNMQLHHYGDCCIRVYQVVWLFCLSDSCEVLSTGAWPLLGATNLLWSTVTTQHNIVLKGNLKITNRRGVAPSWLAIKCSYMNEMSAMPLKFLTAHN